MINTDRRHALIAAIEGVEREVVEAMMAEFYRNPFWEARFGEKGRKHTRQDSNYNLRHLITAIAVDNPASLTEYYHWLRGLLVYRGMCTQHMRETIDLTGRLLAERLPGEWPEIDLYHQASYIGLQYEHPTSRALAENETHIVEQVMARLFAGSRPDVPPETLARARAACRRDLVYHLSYLADAVMVEEQAPDLYEQHLTFLQEFLPTVGVPVESLRESLRFLAIEIDLSLYSSEAAPALAILARSIETIKVRK